MLTSARSASLECHASIEASQPSPSTPGGLNNRRNASGSCRRTSSPRRNDLPRFAARFLPEAHSRRKSGTGPESRCPASTAAPVAPHRADEAARSLGAGLCCGPRKGTMVPRCRAGVAAGSRRCPPLPFTVPEGDAMSSKAHLRPRKRQQQGSRNYVVALLLVLLFLVLLVLAVAMVSSGHGIPPGVR